MHISQTRKNISKIYMEPYIIPNSFSNLDKEEQTRGITIHYIKPHYKATVTIKSGTGMRTDT